MSMLKSTVAHHVTLIFLRISILSNVIRHLISYNPPKSIPLIKTPKRFIIKCNVDFF